MIFLEGDDLDCGMATPDGGRRPVARTIVDDDHGRALGKFH
jgi:hypothetical protein